MKKLSVVLGLIILTVSVNAQSKNDSTNIVKVDTAAVVQIQKILVHSINFLDNGTFRNNYDSVKLAIQELSSIYSYLEQLKKQTSVKPK